MSRYHQRGDALAFRDLMQAHAGMVFATAQRVTRDAVMAEDVAQETFLQLARQSQQVTESVGAWLHRVAWRRACNAVRADATRRKHEDAAMADASLNRVTDTCDSPSGEASWPEVAAALDEVIEELPDHQRAPLVMHFLQGRSQREIAKELHVSQSTVSRAIESGLVELRSRLKGKGVICGAGLGLMLAAQSASAAAVPVSLMITLSKLGMSGIGGGSVIGKVAIPMMVKVGVAFMLVIAGGAVTVNSMKGYQKQARELAKPMAMPLEGSPPPPSGIAKAEAEPVVKEVPGGGLVPNANTIKAASAVKFTPVHELVHSFPTPPENPSGHMVRDAGGWIWGTTGTGGNYGLGTIYKMKPDGSEWQEMVSFNGIVGVPRGSSPRGGLTLAKDGTLWGTTAGGGAKDQGTLFRYDPNKGILTTMVEFERVGSPWGRPLIAADGQLWGTTYASVYRLDPVTGKVVTVFKLPPIPGPRRTPWFQGPLMPDGRGFLWGTTSAGSEEANRGRLWGTSPQDSKMAHGMVYKIDMASGAMTRVVEFTGKSGAAPGGAPRNGLTMDAEGYLWGTTYRGGSKDLGTVFKVHAQSGVFRPVAEFKTQDGDNPGANPETMLIADGQGYFWGTTSYGGAKGHGTIFKVHAATGKLRSVVTFTGIDGNAPGGPARGELFDDGAGSFIGACDFGGAGFVGTLYRVDTRSGKFTLLKDISDLAKTTEGTQPHGRVVAGADGWLWGVTIQSGAHHCGTIYKFNPVTNALVSVIDFTGTKGPHKGRFAREGLASDGQGWLWGSTVAGGKADRGTVYKVNEATGAFVTVVDFVPSPEHGSGTPASEMVPDGKGHMWGTSSSTVFKVNIATNALTTIAKFSVHQKPYFGGERLGTLAMDDRGFMWGCAMGGFKTQRGSLFKVDTANDAFTVVAEFTDANQGWEGWHTQGHMHWDGKGYMWFTGVPDQGGRAAKCALVKVNTRTSAIEQVYRRVGRHSSGTFSAFGTPTSDENGLLWTNSLVSKFGGVQTFDPNTGVFAPVMEFSGQGAQAKAGYQPQVTRLIKHSDGNFYAVTRHGGPGNGGTVFRLRYGPTPMTQEATLLADGRVVLHGTLTPNGLESEADFEWGTEPTLVGAAVLPAARVPAGDAPRPVTSLLSGLKAETTYYFRLRGRNAANVIPQRGAILSFTTPAAKVDGLDAVLAAGAGSGGGAAAITGASRALSGTKHALKVNRIPGAGAGFVTGALNGAAYEVGKNYSLSALADNDYVFHHWTGPGISGAMAENAHLSFVFSEALAKAPVITATFVLNPFRGDAIGSFNGLVYAAEGVTPGVSNTGGIKLSVTHAGMFSGALRYDGETIPLTGAFDTGGLARFGPARTSPWPLVRKGRPVVMVSMQMDLSTTGPHEIIGTIDDVNGQELLDRSVISAARNYYDGRMRIVPAHYLAEGGRYDLAIRGAGDEESSGRMHLTAAGNATFTARFSDGTAVLAQAPLNQGNQAAFFTQLYVRRTGSVGGMIGLDALLQKEESTDQPLWWCRFDQSWLDLAVRSSSSAAGQ